MSFKQQLIELDSCQKATDWVENRTLQQARNDCHRGDWMLWLLEEMKEKEGWLNEKEIMLLGCWCARRVLKYVSEGEDRPLKAIEAKEKWARGKITKEEMDIANAAANDAARATANATASVAAFAAARTTANTIARAAARATANAATKATNTDTWFVAYNKEFLKQADYIRTQFTPPV